MWWIVVRYRASSDGTFSCRYDVPHDVYADAYSCAVASADGGGPGDREHDCDAVHGLCIQQLGRFGFAAPLKLFAHLGMTTFLPVRASPLRISLSRIISPHSQAGLSPAPGRGMSGRVSKQTWTVRACACLPLRGTGVSARTANSVADPPDHCRYPWSCCPSRLADYARRSR